MADITRSAYGGEFDKNFKDMGDGSHAEVISTVVNADAGAGAIIGATADAAVATDAAGTLNAHIRGLVKLLAEIITVKFDQTTPGSTNRIVAGGKTATISATVTRPNDTTQYAAGDQVADSTSAPAAITFSGVARADGGSGVIVTVTCIDSAAQATKPNLRLYLFDGTTAPTPNNDNVAWAPSDADMNNLIGMVEFTSWEVGTSTVGAGGNCASLVRALNIPFVCGAAVDDIWGLLVERGTYTPVATESWKIRLGVLQD